MMWLCVVFLIKIVQVALIIEFLIMFSIFLFIFLGIGITYRRIKDLYKLKLVTFTAILVLGSCQFSILPLLF